MKQKAKAKQQPQPLPSKKKTGPATNTQWHEQFIAELMKFPNVSAACEVCGISWSTAHRHKIADAEFSEAWDMAKRKAADLLEQAMYQRAEAGYLKPVFQGGKKVGEIREFSESTGIFMLKGLKPEVYGDKQKVELSGKVSLSPEEIVAKGNKAVGGFIKTIRAAALAGKEKPHG